MTQATKSDFGSMATAFLKVAFIFSLPLAPASGLDATTIQKEIFKLLAIDGRALDHFGASVSIDGKTLVIGAPLVNDNGQNSGAAYVFDYRGSEWREQAKILASDGAAEDLFGGAVSVDGNTAIVAAAWADQYGEDSGAAYIFVRWGDEWREQAKLLASDGDTHDIFGYDVSVDGDTAIVGALGANHDGQNSGAAYIFVRNAGEWTQQAKLLASDAADRDRFGHAVSIEGNTAIIGAPGNGENGVPERGAAYVFVRWGSQWSERAKILASDAGARNAYFGYDVSIDDGTAVIGAYGDGGNGRGAAYVFGRDGNASDLGWIEQCKLLPSDLADGDQFGRGVSIVGDTVVISAPTAPNTERRGAAYLFGRKDGIWTEQTKLIASDGEVYDVDPLGSAVSVAGDTALVGATGVSDNGYRSGAAYLFSVFMVFQDGFESGDTLEWSRVVCPGCPIANFTWSAANRTVTFLNNSTGSQPLSYTWNFGDGTPISTQQNPQHTYGADGTYEVTLWVSNSLGNDAIAKLVTVPPN